MTEAERRASALDDRDAKLIAAFMLTLQVTVLLSTMLWA